mmetsp:Transcript_10646/g.25622  ORF Transcript_10646/g.25622 Transcript_10646/m.25622 type:complete len:540 (+) Transcript_10646:82-1701(+)
MLPRSVCRSTGMTRNGRQQHKATLFFAKNTRQQHSRYIQPFSTPSVHSLRYFSDKNAHNGSDRMALSASKHKKGVISNTDGKVEPCFAASTVSSIGSFADAENQQQMQQKPQALPSVAPLAMSPSKSSSSSTQLAITSSSTNTAITIPKVSSIDEKKTPSAGKPRNPRKTPTKTNATDGVALAEYYDRIFRFWSERSGTSEILALKESVNEAGTAFDSASAAVTTKRRNLDEALRKWERASGQHMQLLQRRESWTPEDAQRFADFVALEITSRSELEQARHDLGRSEELLTKSQLDYINKMRRRYHEEQIWQDQWRVLGTYGTWTLIVLNSCVFLSSQYYQRRRERDRTETIERLIRESRNVVVPTQGQSAKDDHATSEVLTESKDDTLNENEAVNTEELENNINKIKAWSKEGPMPINPPEFEQTTNVSPKEVEKPSPEVGHKPTYRVYPVLERMGRAIASVGSFVNQWEHKVHSRVMGFAGITNQQLCQTLPARIGLDMPKSVAEIHVPSAIIGASVGGLAAISLSIFFSVFSNRKY